MLRIAELLPAGKIAKPTKLLAAEWYHMTYHKADRNKFVASSKILSNKTIESLTEYFQALFAQKKSNGMLEKQEMNRLHSSAFPPQDLHQQCVLGLTRGGSLLSSQLLTPVLPLT